VNRVAVSVYESGALAELLGDSLHPGGIELTKRLAEVAQLGSGSKVLELACGRGHTASFLCQQYDCKVTGIDLSPSMVAQAQLVAKEGQFLVADAESLPFASSLFDVVLLECSFSLIPDKEKAAAEIWRVLSPGGRLVLTDFVLGGDITPELKAGLNVIPCLAGAQHLQEYLYTLEQVGFQSALIEDHSRELKKMTWELALSCGSWEGLLCKLTAGSDAISAKAYLHLLKTAKPGYVLIAVNKP
jgi:ubiquinone/menaquinone biosynthesis C-methylase UbiE